MNRGVAALVLVLVLQVDNLMKILLDGEERASASFSECVKRMTYEWASEVGKSSVTSDLQ